jgi:hypothetical protein
VLAFLHDAARVEGDEIQETKSTRWVELTTGKDVELGFEDGFFGEGLTVWRGRGNWTGL